VSTKGMTLEGTQVAAATPVRASRLDFIDAQRGIAVTLMIWMHSADGWLRPELKHGAAWETIRALGGFAAPLFFFLAGLGVGLRWSDPAAAEPPGRGRQELARGLQLVVLGYGLRLQMWMVDAGGAAKLEAWIAAVPLALGLASLYHALSAIAGTPYRDGPRSGSRLTVNLGWAGFGVTATALGLTLMAALVPDRMRPLLRVDVLQGLGASLVVIACVRSPLRRWPLLGLIGAAAVALITPWVRAQMPGALPTPLAGYVASWDAAPGRPPPTLFPLFPWLAYVPAGVFFGTQLAASARRVGARRAALTWSAIGAALCLLTCEPWPLSQRLLAEWPWLTQCVRVGYRLGAALIFGGVAVALTRVEPIGRPLVTLGRASLFVYWVHLELAFGVLSRPVARQLGYAQWAIGFIALLALMVIMAKLWPGLRGRLRSGGRVLRPDPDPSAA
jgi:uncharacterized membrane protein